MLPTGLCGDGWVQTNESTSGPRYTDTERSGFKPQLQLPRGHFATRRALEAAKVDSYWVSIERYKGIDPSSAAYA